MSSLKAVFFLFLYTLNSCYSDTLSLKFPSLQDSKKQLFSTLNPRSIQERLIFFALYPETEEGQEIFNSLKKQLPNLTHNTAKSLAKIIIDTPLDQKELELIKNQLNLFFTPLEELIFQEEENPQKALIQLFLITKEIESALVDNPSKQQIIDQINHQLFQKMHIRFPKLSEYEALIDQYSSVPSVLDQRQGVCLGTSLLYLVIGERLGLDLALITPPGHIFLREKSCLINIETTARGVHVPDQYYLNINTHTLQEREKKEAQALVFFNQAAAFATRKNHEKAIESYQKVLKIIEQDPLTEELLAYQLIIIGKEQKALQLLKNLIEKKDSNKKYQLADHQIKQDYINKKADKEGLELLFQSEKRGRKQLLEERENLEKILKKTPEFRYALFQMAMNSLSLYRPKEAITYLEKYHAIFPGHPIVEYLLSSLYLERLNLKQSLYHFHHLKKIVNHNSKALKSLEHTLIMHTNHL